MRLLVYVFTFGAHFSVAFFFPPKIIVVIFANLLTQNVL